MMKILIIKLSIAFFIILLATTQSFAKGNWVVLNDPFGGNMFRLHNTKTDQTTSTAYKDKKNAKRAAKILNKADKGVRDLNEPGCNEAGVVC